MRSKEAMIHMKKIFMTLAFVFTLSCPAYADGEPAHIAFGNVVNITGGNDSVYIQNDDYSPGYRTTASSVTVVDANWSYHPVSFRSIPSGRNALMNPGEPVDIIVRGDKLKVLSWGGDGVYLMRLLDSDGNTIVKDTLRTRQNSQTEIALTPEYKHYYLEFTETDAEYDSENGYFPSVNSSENEIRYCYVLLRMKGTNEENEPEVKPSVQPEKKESAVQSEKRESKSATEAIEDIYRSLRNKAVNDSVIRMDDTKNETPEPDEAIRQKETHEVHEENAEDDNEEEGTNLIPARRIRIKRSTDYENVSE